jgi:hypothetical protein
MAVENKHPIARLQAQHMRQVMGLRAVKGDGGRRFERRGHKQPGAAKIIAGHGRNDGWNDNWNEGWTMR